MSKVVDKAVNYAIQIANDDSHGYDQASRWGNPDFDCSALVITAYEEAGLKVKEAGASYTGDMKAAFKKVGFKDVTKSVNLKTGDGLVKGDVLLKEGSHTALYIGGGKMVQASINEKNTITGGKKGDQTGREIYVANYKNFPWGCVLRYGAHEEKPAAGFTQKVKVTGDSVNVRKGGSTKYGILCVVHKDDILEYDGTQQNGWYHVKVNGVTGYISNKYSKVTTEGAAGFTQKVKVTGGSVNVRKGGGTQYNILCVVHLNDILEYDGTKQNGWYHVKAKGVTGYISPNYVKIV